MRRGVQNARAGGWINTETDLSRSVAELDREKPGWDVDARLRGVVRRLQKNPTAEGVQAAIDVYGQASVYQAMPCAGLRVVGDSVLAADGQRLYPLPVEADRDALSAHLTAVEVFTRADLSDLTERETEVLVALAQGRTSKDIAESLGVSRNTFRQLHLRLMNKLRHAARQDASGEADALALLQKYVAE